MKRRALDLYCGAGGASMGLARAGYEVLGVDIRKQPRYPFAFIRADALEFPVGWWDWDLIWASPPCQGFTTLRHLQGREYPNFIAATRALLQSTGVPYVIENVPGAPLESPVLLCGSSFGLGVWRHRIFETSFPITVPQCEHAKCPEPIDVTGSGGQRVNPRTTPGGNSRKPLNVQHARKVMGIDWMSRKELSQAIPPAYSEFIAHAALNAMAKL